MGRSNSLRFQFDFDPESHWNCTWQDKYGSGGNLEYCLDMVSSYIEGNNRSVDEVCYQLLKEGHASGFWWSIWYEDDQIDQEEDIDNDFAPDQEASCYFYKDTD